MPRTNARGRGQFFEAKSKAEDKILALRPACPGGVNITGKTKPAPRQLHPSSAQLHQSGARTGPGSFHITVWIINHTSMTSVLTSFYSVFYPGTFWGGKFPPKKKSNRILI